MNGLFDTNVKVKTPAAINQAAKEVPALRAELQQFNDIAEEVKAYIPWVIGIGVAAVILASFGAFRKKGS